MSNNATTVVCLKMASANESNAFQAIQLEIWIISMQCTSSDIEQYTSVSMKEALINNYALSYNPRYLYYVIPKVNLRNYNPERTGMWT